MNGCVYRTRSDLCMKFTTDQSISFCVGKKCPDRKQSNADRIREMTDEELAKKISGIEQFALTTDGAWPPEKWLDWLKKEASDD